MPLIIAESPNCPDSNYDLANFDNLFSNFPQLEESTFRLFDSDKPPRCFDPERDPVLYVMQGEIAIVPPQDETIQFILTDDTTTCITGIVRHRQSGVTCLAHYDRPLEDDIFHESLDALLQKMTILASKNLCATDLSTNPTSVVRNNGTSEIITELGDPFKPNADFDLYLIGGYCDERSISEELAIFILQQFNAIERYQINLACAFIGPLNTKCMRIADAIRVPGGANIPAPKVYGAAIDVRNGTLLNATLNRVSASRLREGVPLFEIRRAAVSFGTVKKFREIYDPERRYIVIEPVSFESVNSAGARSYFQYALRLRDQDILKKFSTSPYVEPDHFVQDNRNVFQFFLSHHQRDIRRLYFPADRPRYFRHYRLLPQSDSSGVTPVKQSCQDSSSSSSLDNMSHSAQYRWREYSPSTDDLTVNGT